MENKRNPLTAQERRSLISKLQSDDLSFAAYDGRIYVRNKNPIGPPRRLGDYLRTQNYSIKPSLYSAEYSLADSRRRHFYANAKSMLRRPPPNMPELVEIMLAQLEDEERIAVRASIIDTIKHCLRINKVRNENKPFALSKGGYDTLCRIFEQDIRHFNKSFTTPYDHSGFNLMPDLNFIAAEFIRADRQFQHADLYNIVVDRLASAVDEINAEAAARFLPETIVDYLQSITDVVRRHPHFVSRDYVSLQANILRQRDHEPPPKTSHTGRGISGMDYLYQEQANLANKIMADMKLEAACALHETIKWVKAQGREPTAPTARELFADKTWGILEEMDRRKTLAYAAQVILKDTLNIKRELEKTRKLYSMSEMRRELQKRQPGEAKSFPRSSPAEFIAEAGRRASFRRQTVIRFGPQR